MVSAENSVRHAAQIMLDRCVSGLPVLSDDGRVIGIVTEGDLLRRTELGEFRHGATSGATAERRARDYVKSSSWKVGDVMSGNVVAVEEKTPVNRIASLMAEHGIKRVPVLREGKLVGIVSRCDLLKAICAAPPESTASGDIAIARSIRARLSQDLDLGGDQMRISVERGVVHVQGTVGSEAERKAVQTVAKGLPNVTRIELDICVASAGAGPEPQ
ncbi:CBS domain-containing protein [Chelativorans sp. AA-79]|uniref:CBS domain-containing protein n=1 Tax=Chelativorans sp. AA-79 TaxID=3028735 RepID=UPI0023F678D6|nr:CBS domain-containing protein [Chelativorans sp. AA-79]WEX10735.1 CBS domain-containing protein [Chelativorans sp. AA-79]